MKNMNYSNLFSLQNIITFYFNIMKLMLYQTVHIGGSFFGMDYKLIIQSCI